MLIPSAGDGTFFSADELSMAMMTVPRRMFGDSVEGSLSFRESLITITTPWTNLMRQQKIAVS